MKILIIDPSSGGGIYQASCYLRDYLREYHEVEMISVHDLNNKIDYCYDLVLIHDFVFDPSNIEVKCPIAYFIPGVFPYDDESYLDEYKYCISPVSDFRSDNKYKKSPDIQWCFNIHCPEEVNTFRERKDELLYVGRIDAYKMSVHFLAEFLKHGHKMTVAGEIRQECEEEELMAKLLTHENINYLGVVPHDEAIELMKQHKFAVLASQTDIFSLYMLEAIYYGCIPIIERRKLVEYPWVVDSTYKVWNALDIVNVYEILKSFPNEILQQYRDFHRQQVIDKMNNLSDINVFNRVFE